MKELLTLVLFLLIGNRSKMDNVSLFLRFLVYKTGSSKYACVLAKHGVERLSSQYPGSVRKRDQPGLHREPRLKKKHTYTHYCCHRAVEQFQRVNIYAYDLEQ